MFYLQLIISFEGLGMLFSAAALIRRLRKYNAKNGHDATTKTKSLIFSRVFISLARFVVSAMMSKNPESFEMPRHFSLAPFYVGFVDLLISSIKFYLLNATWLFFFLLSD